MEKPKNIPDLGRYVEPYGYVKFGKVEALDSPIKEINYQIKAIYVRNYNMSEGKVASQIAHAVKNLPSTPKDCNIIVLKVSKSKFEKLCKEHNCSIHYDKGLTEVEEGTATAAAWIELKTNT